MARIHNLSVLRLRNITAADAALDAGLNLFYGANGAGKTAMLEAVHLLARGRSFRSAQASKVIQNGCEDLIVRARVQADGSALTRQLAVQRFRQGPIQAHVDGESVPGIATLALHLPIQVMLPNVADLVFGGPAERRSWIDWGVFHVEHHHMAAARRYAQALRQRNARLKQLDRTLDSDPLLQSLSVALIEAAMPLSRARQNYFERIQSTVREVLNQLYPNLAGVAFDLRPDGLKTTESLEVLLVENLARDVKSGMTHAGPHRFELKLMIDGRSAADRLSRGQGKALALAMKIAQAMDLQSMTGESSIFLIDDAGAELDQTRNRAFFEWLGEIDAQVLATATEATRAAELNKQIRLFHVKQGELSL